MAKHEFGIMMDAGFPVMAAFCQAAVFVSLKTFICEEKEKA